MSSLPRRSRLLLTVVLVLFSALVRLWRYVYIIRFLFGYQLTICRSASPTAPSPSSPANSTPPPRSSPRSNGPRLSSLTSLSGPSEPARSLPLSRLRRSTPLSASGSVRPSPPRLPTTPVSSTVAPSARRTAVSSPRRTMSTVSLLAVLA